MNFFFNIPLYREGNKSFKFISSSVTLEDISDSYKENDTNYFYYLTVNFYSIKHEKTTGQDFFLVLFTKM